jgi:hypothetical protein
MNEITLDDNKIMNIVNPEVYKLRIQCNPQIIYWTATPDGWPTIISVDNKPILQPEAFYITAFLPENATTQTLTKELVAAEIRIFSKFIQYNQGMAGRIHCVIRRWQKVQREWLFFTKASLVFIPDIPEFSIKMLQIPHSNTVKQIPQATWNN